MGIGFAFHWMLAPYGRLIIDSATRAQRGGAWVNPAAATVEYFELFGFHYMDRLDFRVAQPPEGCDDQFTELLFVSKF
jgi:hypothetical protein